MGNSFLSPEEIESLVSQLREDAAIKPAGAEIPRFAREKAGKGEEGEHTGANNGAAQVRRVVFSSLDPVSVKGREADISSLGFVKFPLELVLGETTLTVGQILNLKKGSVIVLNKLAGENAQLLLKNKPIAEGEVVVLNDCFAMRINSLVEEKEGKKLTEEKESRI